MTDTLIAEPIGADLLPIPDRVQARIDALGQTHENLRRELASRDSAIRMIGEALREEAEERDWCSEYDEFVKKLNERLPNGVELPTRQREFRVSFVVTATQDFVDNQLESLIDTELNNENFGSCSSYDAEVN